MVVIPAQRVWSHAEYTRWYRKVPVLLLLLSTSVKEEERGGQGYTSVILLHQSAT